tara:strand:+ start:97 stop:813 length:717 start_codon:yes stop_codon:yes gene_type:complete
MNIIQKIHTGNPFIRPRGWKMVELPCLHKSLKDEFGSTLIVGERGSEDGVLATVLENEKLIRPIHCIDIGDINTEEVGDKFKFGQEKLKEEEIKFFNADLVEWESEFGKYNNIICVNVLEHFGFNQSGDLEINDYDVSGFAKMLTLCNENLILSVPYEHFATSEIIAVGERKYSQSRISILETFARQVGFYLKEEIKFVMFTPEGGLLFEEISKSNIDRMRFEAHECLIFLWFKKEGK